MRKLKYKLYWHGVNWWTADNDKAWRADVKAAYNRLTLRDLEQGRMRNNVRAWMLRNHLVLK